MSHLEYLAIAEATLVLGLCAMLIAAAITAFGHARPRTRGPARRHPVATPPLRALPPRDAPRGGLAP